ncbi:M16 family metallopeptidase [Sphingomonas quercus]|uniref:Insulinase family protein n=1 Tax=Sphingomonas quercus TaxID=2842451 RepID=A0ABS6BLM3_9SPHN|nr:insulinase family protein [Sphingomonas quercus]
MTARLHRLANGLTVAVEPMAGVETLAVGLYADAGARSEPAGLSGLAHLVEHMVFKGAGGRDARGIAEAIEDVGGSINAWTARDHTVFHARLLAGDLALGVDIIADLARAPRFAEDELEREKGVVLAELGEARDTPDDIIFDHLQITAFPGQPLGLPVLGDEASIAAVTTADLRGWTETQYRPEGLVLAAAGKIDEDALLRLAEARFGDLAPGAPERPAPASFTGGGAHQDARRFDQVHLALAWPGVGHTDADQHALSLFAQAAGGGMSSRLFQELREARGLAYSIYSWVQSFAETGLLGVYLAAAKADASRALALARETMAAVADGLTPEELDRARAQSRAGLLMGLESVQGRCDHLARQIQIHGRIVPATETVAQIDAVTLDQARAAGRRALDGGEVLATVGGRLAKAA